MSLQQKEDVNYWKPITILHASGRNVVTVFSSQRNIEVHKTLIVNLLLNIVLPVIKPKTLKQNKIP